MTIDKRISYQWGGPGGKSPGTSASGGSRGGGGHGEGQARELARQPRYTAPAPAPKPAPTPTRAPQESQRREEVKEKNLSLIRDFEEKKAEQEEAKRASDFAEARKLMTQPENFYDPLARTIQPLGKIDPYQESYVLPNRIMTNPWSEYDFQKEQLKKEQLKTPVTLDKLPAGLGDVPGDVTPKKTYTPPVRHHGINTGEEAYEMVGGVKVPLNMRGVKGVDPREDLERYFEEPGRDPFLVPEGERTIEDKEKIENFERAQDYDLIDEMRRKGYNFEEIQSAIDKGLTVKAPTTDTSRQGLIDYGLSTLKNFIPETDLEKSLLSRLKSFAPGAKTGISSLTDKMGGLGQYFNPGKMLTSFALNKMGLSFLNPILGIASLFGFNPFKNLGTGYSGIPTKNQPTMGGRGGDAENVVQASIQKFQPTQSQQDQMAEIMRKRMILQGYADKGSLNERGQDTLTQMNNLISQYQADPRSIYG